MRTVLLASLLLFCSLISVVFAQTQNDPVEPSVITGKVIDSGGASVQGAKVYVREHNVAVSGSVRYVTTDGMGHFRIANLRPGDYDVYAVPSNSASMLSHWARRAHLDKEKLVADVTVRIGSPRSGWLF